MNQKQKEYKKELRYEDIRKLAEFFEILIEIDGRTKIVRKGKP